MATRGKGSAGRLEAIGITKSEFAERAGIDRGTLDRALGDDPRVSPRTWGKIETALTQIEDELGMAESGTMVTSTITIGEATITLAGHPSEVAETIRRLLDRPKRAPTVGGPP